MTAALYMDDLVSDAIKGNRVQAVVYRAVTKRGVNRIRKAIEQECLGEGAVMAPALMLADHARILRGEKPVYLSEALRRMGGRLLSVTPNLRTTVGINYAAGNLWGTDSGQVAIADTIALSNNNSAPAAGDSSASTQWATGVATDGAAGPTRGEWTGLGLTRKAATMAHTGGATTLTASATWTATGSSTASQLAGLFGGAGKATQGSGATNVLFLENTFTPTSLATNDQLSLTWTITF